MTQQQQQYAIGDRVKVNSRGTGHVGRKGVVKFYSGGQYWVRMDDNDEVVPALHRWMLEPDS